MDEEISALIALLGDAQYDAYKLAAKKLRRIGLPAAPALRGELGASNPVRATRAARLLGEIGDTDAVPLLRSLNTDGLPDLASAVATALGQLRRVSQTQETSRRAVVEVRLQQAARNQRDGTDVWKPPTPDANLPMADRQRVSIKRRQELTLPTEIDGLITALTSQDYARRMAASNALVRKRSDAVPALLAVLKHDGYLVRIRAIDALGKIRDDTALPAVARYFVDATDPQVWELVAPSLLLLSENLGMRPRPELLDGYIDLVRMRSHPGSTWIPNHVCIEGAMCLEAIADLAPGPELRRALTYLKGIRPFVPAEFVRARLAIERATSAWSALPLPAEEPGVAHQDLPLPASVELTSEENLPRTVDLEPSVRPRRAIRLPDDAGSLIDLLETADDETRRLVEGALMLGIDRMLSEICVIFPQASLPVQEILVRVLCAHPSLYALPTLELARRQFPENATLRRTVEKLRT